MNALELEGITKAYSGHLAVDDLNLVVPRGSVYGIIGPNGSGKTTTLRMILRIIMPDRGRITVLGRDHSGTANNQISYLPEERGLYKKMRVRDVLRFFAQLKGVPDWPAQVNYWLDRFELTKWARKNVDALSKGMAQKVQFIAAVITRPELLILDEPFSGLDPVNQEVLKDTILELRTKGTTILFSTHDMDVAQKMCDRICMIFRGRKVLDDKLSDIQARYGSDTLRVRTDSTNGTLHDLPGVLSVNDYGQYQELRISRDASPRRILEELMRRTSVVQHFEVVHPSLHDIFIRIAGPQADQVTTHA